MYKIGDKIVYPMYGAGTICAFEERNILGEMCSYYVLNISTTGEKHYVPVKTADTIGVRHISEEKDLEKIYAALKTEPDCCTASNWNKRYRENIAKLKTGLADEVAKVISTLSVREKKKPLSSIEKKMLNNARKILISELVLVERREPDEVESMLDSSLT